VFESYVPRVQKNFFLLLSLDDRSTATQNCNVDARYNALWDRWHFKVRSQLQLTIHLCARSSQLRFVTSIGGKLRTGLGIPRIVTITNRHIAQISIREYDTRNVL